MSTDTRKPPPPEQSLLLPFHPACAVFPEMKGAEFDELVADIKKHGLRVPITTFREPIPRPDGSICIYEMRTLIVDGRNRARACAKAGVTPRYEEFDGDADEVVRFIISANIHRRHLTVDDRRKYLKLLIEWKPEKSNRTLAAETGVSEPTVRRARSPASHDAPATKRVGRDGKAYRLPARFRRAHAFNPRKNAW